MRGSIVGQSGALYLQYPPMFTPTLQHSPGSSALPVWHPLEGGENAVGGWEATQIWPCLLAFLAHELCALDKRWLISDTLVYNLNKMAVPPRA